MFQVPHAIWTLPHDIWKRPIQPAQPGVGLQLQPFSGGSSWSRRSGALSTVRYAARTPCHLTRGARDGGLLSGKGVPDARRGPQAWRRRKPLSNPHWANTEPFATSGFTSHRKVFWGSCRCRSRRCRTPETSRSVVKGDIWKTPLLCSCGHDGVPHSPRDRPAPGCLVAGLGPLLPPSRLPEARVPSTRLDSYTLSTPTHQLAFASRWGSTVPQEYLPAPRKHEALGKKNAKLQIASTTCSSPRVGES